MSDTRHYTDIHNTFKDVIAPEQKKYWVEFQLLDELGKPLANLPYRAVNQAVRDEYIPEFAGHTDAQGVIRLDDLHALPMTLLMVADPFAEELQTRRLRGARPEPPTPHIGDRTPPYGPQRAGFSPIESDALAAGHTYHYLRIGQLCDGAPVVTPPWGEAELQEFHLPDPSFSGFTIPGELLERRHVLEVCPFRAWSLVLHHQKEYSLANAYNLGLMSNLAYTSAEGRARGSVEDFFLRQSLDLSRTPRVWDRGQVWPCLVVDVPFSERYTDAVMQNTNQAIPPEGDVQFFYAISACQVLVAWRGTESVSDLLTDLAFRPVASGSIGQCDRLVSCPELTAEGSVHQGFRSDFEKASRIFEKMFNQVASAASDDKQLYICGHSLGGSLGLVHSASVRSLRPLLYTYGMPRTFTLKAVECLGDVWHFRHVNDRDLVAWVPAAAGLDNHLYQLYGPLGHVFGYGWSVFQLTASPFLSIGDPYSHHGELAAFFYVEQHALQRGSPYPAYRNKEGLGAPYYNEVARRLPKTAKLYLVPSLCIEDDQKARQSQETFTKALSAQARDMYFPSLQNVPIGKIANPLHHFMSHYLSYLHNQLLEAISPDRMQGRRNVRIAFKEQLDEFAVRISADERVRNQAFLDLQDRIPEALNVTRQLEGGARALERFDNAADANAYYEITVHRPLSITRKDNA